MMFNLNSISRDPKWTAMQILMAYDEWRDAYATWDTAADKAQALLDSQNPADEPVHDALYGSEYARLFEQIGKINEPLRLDCPLFGSNSSRKHSNNYPVDTTLRCAKALRAAAKKLESLK